MSQSTPTPLRSGSHSSQRRPYLEETAIVRVRFNEVDALHIVWHGHYANYFEEARRAWGRRFDLDYQVFFKNNVAAPVVHLSIDYLMPARFYDVLEVKARLLRSEAAKLEFEYEIRRQGEAALLACGKSVQVFSTPEGELILAWPPLMLERFKLWEPLWMMP